MTFAVAANEKGEKVLTMSKEYIERQRAIVDACNSLELYPSEYATLEDALNRIPAADVAEVRHGRWIRPHWKNSNYCCDCSECGGEAMHREYQWDKNGIYPICPNCGAKMDKKGRMKREGFEKRERKKGHGQTNGI